jgi:hypothetical protein
MSIRLARLEICASRIRNVQIEDSEEFSPTNILFTFLYLPYLRHVKTEAVFSSEALLFTYNYIYRYDPDDEY